MLKSCFCISERGKIWTEGRKLMKHIISGKFILCPVNDKKKVSFSETDMFQCPLSTEVIIKILFFFRIKMTAEITGGKGDTDNNTENQINDKNDNTCKKRERKMDFYKDVLGSPK